MRKKLHEGHSTLVYQFDIDLIEKERDAKFGIGGRLPDSGFATAKAMRELWNKFVELSDEVWEKVKDLDKRKREPYYKELDEKLSAIARETPFERGMYFWKWALLERFKDARKAAMQGKRGWPKEHNPPLKKLNIPFRTDTGKNIPRASDFIFNARNHLYIRPVSEEAYYDDSRKGHRMRGTQGHIDINSDRVAFRTNFDRELPMGALLPRYALIGRSHGKLGWNWSLELTLRCPPGTTSVHVPKTNKIASLDVGWRRFNDPRDADRYVINHAFNDYLRIGLLTDSTGAMFEIRLPFDLSNNRERRMRERLLGYGLDEPRLLLDYRIIAETQTRRDLAMERCKAELGPLMHTIPSDLQRHGEAWRLCRQSCLKRLYYGRKADPEREIEGFIGLKDRCPDLLFTRILAEWIKTDDRFLRDISSLYLHLERKREHVYREVAAWLAEIYDALVWEGDLSLIGMQEDKSNDPIKEAAKKYRVMASLYSFRQAVKAAFAKRGREIIGSPTAYSTQTCYECLGHIEPGPSLILECENGHRCDQDKNASTLMLLEVLGIEREELETRAVTGFSASVDRSQISRYVVPVSW